MIIDCISDLHGYYPKLEGGDLLIVAGDLTGSDDWGEQIIFCDWLSKQPYKKRIVIAGNHDNDLIDQSVGDYTFSAFDKEAGTQKSYATYLCDSGTEFEGLKIWGSPWTKTFPGMNPRCKAFTLDTEEELAEKWGLIPDDVDILVTHSPPLGMMDGVQRYSEGKIEHVGSEYLSYALISMKRKPKLHVWGHVHQGYGMLRSKQTFMVNASHVNECYEPVNKPIRIEL